MILSFMMSSVQAGYWTNAILHENDVDRAKARASQKCHHYKEVSEIFKASLQNRQGDLEKYIKQHHPELNIDIITQGIVSHFEEKTRTWLWKYENTNKESAALQDSYHKLASGETSPTLLKNKGVEEVVKKAISISQGAQLPQLALSQLKTIQATLVNHIHEKKGSAVDNEEENLLHYVNTIIPEIKLKKKAEGLRNIHHWLHKELHKLMGIKPEHLSQPFKQSSAAVIIEPGEFKRDITENDRPRWAERVVHSFSWKKEDSFRWALPWGHGDKMVALCKKLSPHTTIYRGHTPPYLTTNENLQADLEKVQDLFKKEVDYYSTINSSIVFNFSWAKTDRPACYIKSTNQGLQLNFKELTAESKYTWEKFLYESLKEKFPHKNWDEELDKEQVEYLEEFQRKQMSRQPYAQLAKDLVIGSQGDKTHMIVAASSNGRGNPLTKKGLHNGWIELLASDVTQDHSIVPLEYNPCQKLLETHVPGEYEDRALIIPCAYMSIDFCDDFIPYFFHGGNSSAAVIESALISALRGHFPELDHIDVRTAILRGANRTYGGYLPKYDGQGMINWKGAFAVAEKILTEKKKLSSNNDCSSANTSQIKDSVFSAPSKPESTSQNPNRGTPLLKIPPKSENCS